MKTRNTARLEKAIKLLKAAQAELHAASQETTWGGGKGDYARAAQDVAEIISRDAGEAGLEDLLDLLSTKKAV